MLTEEQIQQIEMEYNIKRQTRADGKCVFGLYDEGKGCGRPAVTWLRNVSMDVDGGSPDLLHICKYHADLFGIE